MAGKVSLKFIIIRLDSKETTFEVWPFYDHFWSFFHQLRKYLSQNLDADGHFDAKQV
jgi:hypothetical protein